MGKSPRKRAERARRAKAMREFRARLRTLSGRGRRGELRAVAEESTPYGVGYSPLGGAAERVESRVMVKIRQVRGGERPLYRLVAVVANRDRWSAFRRAWVPELSPKYIVLEWGDRGEVRDRDVTAFTQKLLEKGYRESEIEWLD